ncbi:MAG: hypothetical protein AAF512_20135 [Pseudomonadota bacterium]
MKHKKSAFLNISSVLSAWCLLFTLFMPAVASAEEEKPYPRYKASSRQPEPVDIRTSSYGASRSAPNALQVGDKVSDFNVPRAGGGTVSLAELRSKGPVAIIFYRGHW